MAASDGTTFQVSLPPDPRLLRVLRLVASAMASLGEFDLAAVEEVRVAVDELGTTLISASRGAPIEISFELTDTTLCIDGRTTLDDGTDLEVDPLTDRILAVVASSHEWNSSDGVAHGHVEKHMAGAAGS